MEGDVEIGRDLRMDRERGWGVFLLCPKFTYQLPSLLVMYHELSSAERYMNRLSSSVYCVVCGVSRVTKSSSVEHGTLEMH